MNISELSMRRPVTTMMLFLSVVVIGAISTRFIPLEFFPEFDAPFIFVDLPYPGSSPEETERLIARPAEEVLATIPGIKRMTSNSHANGAWVQLHFDWGENTVLKGSQVREKLDNVQDQFPSDMERYFVFQRSSSDMPVLNLRVSSDRDLSGSYDLLNRKIKRRLERIEGVSKVDLNGVEPKELRIEMIADRIQAHNINLVDLTSNLRQANFSVSAGKIDESGRRFVVRPMGQLTTPEAVGNLIIDSSGLRLRDVAEIIYDDPVLDYGRHLDREYAIAVEVTKEGGANTVEVTRNILEELETLREDPEMTGIALFEMDNAGAGIISSLNELLNSGFLGAVLAFFVLYIFLRRFATTAIVSVAVPISLLITVGALYFLGFSLNILTMMGLMLAVGMLVDNAVVVTESIHRHQLLTPDDPRGASLRGVKEVSMAVTAGTFTTAIVFLPIIVSQADQITVFLKHVSVTICIALAASLLIAQTIVPMLTARLKPQKKKKETKFINSVVKRYERTLGWLLRHPKTAGVIVLAVLASVIVPAKFVNMDFGDEESGERRLRLFYHLTGAFPLERVEGIVDEMEEYLYDNKDEFEIRSVYTWYTPEFASSTILLTDEDEAKLTPEEIQEKIEAGLPRLAAARPSFSWRTSENQEAQVRAVLQGESTEVLVEIAERLALQLEQIEGFKDVMTESEDGADEIHVSIDRERARQYGFTSQQVARTISNAMRGTNLRRFHTSEGEVQMLLKFQGEDQRSLDDLRNVTVHSNTGNPVKLASLADFQITKAARNIFRENRITTVGIHASLEKDVDSGDARRILSQVLSSYDFPPGYSWGFGTRFSNDEQSQNIMLRNLLLALALIYLVMAGLFESLIHPAAIWTSIVFAIVGVFWFFLITDTTFSLMAWIGILVLVGVVVNNGIVLIDHINHLRSTGLNRYDAIVNAGSERFRPILMTAATTVLGLIPLCIGNTLIGGDGPPYYPMARAIVGGLTFSTFVTLLILPTVYVMMDNLRYWSRDIVEFARYGRKSRNNI